MATGTRNEGASPRTENKFSAVETIRSPDGEAGRNLDPDQYGLLDKGRRSYRGGGIEPRKRETGDNGLPGRHPRRDESGQGRSLQSGCRPIDKSGHMAILAQFRAGGMVMPRRLMVVMRGGMRVTMTLRFGSPTALAR
jgi:hypothetical protein